MKTALTLAALLLLATAAQADQIHLREYRGNVCYDGDTCYVVMYGLPESLQNMSVRIRGIDAPERRGKCKAEREQAKIAAAFANTMFRHAKTIEFKNLKWGKYGGRLLADVVIDGRDYAALIIKEGLARAYDGGRRRGWC